MPADTRAAPKLKRTMDPTKRQQVILPINANHVRLLNRLLATGMWGSTATQVALRLFDGACAAQLTKDSTL